MLKFKVSPSVRAAAIPTGTGFGAFDGMYRHCESYTKVKGKGGKMVLRCDSFKDGFGKPKCPAGLKDGGRSPGLVRDGYCAGTKLVKSKAKKAAAKKAPAKKKAAPRAKKK
jgi:hypothetical protein